jgi:hypothetical protein
MMPSKTTISIGSGRRTCCAWHAALLKRRLIVARIANLNLPAITVTSASYGTTTARRRFTTVQTAESAEEAKVWARTSPIAR